MTPEPIEGLVAQILNARELVINRGSTHGVRPDMIFEVLADEADDIVDPETGESLGSVDRPKVPVRVIQVKDRLAVARTFRSREKNVGGAGGVGLGGLPALQSFNRMFDPPRFVRVYDTFKSDHATWENIEEEDSYVKIGDRVRQSLRYGDR